MVRVKIPLCEQSRLVAALDLGSVGGKESRALGLPVLLQVATLCAGKAPWSQRPAWQGRGDRKDILLSNIPPYSPASPLPDCNEVGAADGLSLVRLWGWLSHAQPLFFSTRQPRQLAALFQLCRQAL